MQKYTVYFVVKDWVEVQVKSESQENAIEQAHEIVRKSIYKDKRIVIVDGNEKFAGITLNDVVDVIDS